MNALASTPNIESELRFLAELAGSAVSAHPDLGTSVMRKARARRRRRYGLAGITAGVGLLGSVAAVTLGGGPYFHVTQPSGAMTPTIVIGDSVTFNRELTPRTGDVVYLDLGEDGHGFKAISRVIGEPGDTVACRVNATGRCDAVLVDGKRLNAYLDGLTTRPFAATIVPRGHIFVMGDDRSRANDSRLVGSLPLDSVEGVAVATEDRAGHPWAVPGAPHHDIPDDQNLIDPPLPVPPASAG